MKRRQDHPLPPIVFDCDDVLLNWQGGFAAWMTNVNGIPLDPAGPNSWNMDEWVGRPALPYIEIFNGSHRFGQLDAVVGAKAAVRTLYGRGHELHVITACADDPSAILRRERNLDRVFGDVFTSINCIPLGTSKAEALATVPKGIWIEDNVNHAITGAMLGHRTFIMRRNHNAQREDEGGDEFKRLCIQWIDDFQPILNRSSFETLLAAE